LTIFSASVSLLVQWAIVELEQLLELATPQYFHQRSLCYHQQIIQNSNFLKSSSKFDIRTRNLP